MSFPSGDVYSGEKVVVLGAGLAWLVADCELQNRDTMYLSLRPKRAPVGRVRKIREPLSDDLYAEAGDARIPSTHKLTLRWVRQFGLRLQRFYPSKLSTVVLLRRRRIMPAGGVIDMSQVDLQLTAAERRVGLSKLAEHYYGAAMRRIGEWISCSWPSDIDALGDTSFADYLRRMGASREVNGSISGCCQVSLIS
jgi:monoamine oxidase